MPLVRCPQCGRVADGRNCFACGYEWPAGGAALSTPPAAATNAPPQVPPRTQPFAASTPPPTPRGMTPLQTPAPSVPPRTPTSPPTFSSSPPTNPFATNAKNPFQQVPPPVTRPSSPGFPAPGSSPRFEAPRSPVFEPPVPAPPPAFAMAPPAAFVPSMPAADEIVIDNDLAFSLAGGAMDPQLGGGLPPPPPGLPPPPALATPPRYSNHSDPAAMVGGLDSIFDGIDIAVPKAAPGPMIDAALEAGDFLPKPTIQNENFASPVDDPSNESIGMSLGADLVSAFNAVDTESLAAPGPLDLDTRLRALAELLRGEGRTLDADLVSEAIAALQLSR